MAAQLLTPDERGFLAAARRAILATIDPAGQARLVPICFVVADGAAGPVLYTPIDEKPKSRSDPLELARVRDIVERPAVTVLVERWDEDWTRLGWLRLRGTASVMDAAPATVVALLRGKYPQYRAHALERRPAIRIALVATRSWGNLSPEET